MARRSDHSRDELRQLIVEEGHRQIAQVGFASFSARQLAKRIGYTVGTVYNVFGSLDNLMLAINGRTLDKWRHYLLLKLADQQEGRLTRAVEAYFEFAILNRNAWLALLDFRLPEDQDVPEDYATKVGAIMAVVCDEVRRELTPAHAAKAEAITRSLLATVHGHCFFTLNGTFEVIGETDPIKAALGRVNDALAAFRQAAG
jgi:AcrR family transcriptional regulator